jgi:hypothetical protein
MRCDKLKRICHRTPDRQHSHSQVRNAHHTARCSDLQAASVRMESCTLILDVRCAFVCFDYSRLRCGSGLHAQRSSTMDTAAHAIASSHSVSQKKGNRSRRTRVHDCVSDSIHPSVCLVLRVCAQSAERVLSRLLGGSGRRGHRVVGGGRGSCGAGPSASGARSAHGATRRSDRPAQHG